MRLDRRREHVPPRVRERPQIESDERLSRRSAGGRALRGVSEEVCEALGQGIIQRLVRGALDGLLPELLSDVPGREAEQRVRVAELLDGLDE